MFSLITFLGLFAACLTTFAALPQLIKVLRTKKTEDISILMYVILNIGIAIWVVYGFLVMDIPILFGNIVGLFINLPILVYKLKFG